MVISSSSKNTTQQLRRGSGALLGLFTLASAHGVCISVDEHWLGEDGIWGVIRRKHNGSGVGGRPFAVGFGSALFQLYMQ